MPSATAVRVVFSLDLQHGIPLGSPDWGPDPAEIAAEVIRCGVAQLIVLDLAGVGTGTGVPTIPLCRTLRARHGPDVQIITGGGVRDQADLNELEGAGVDGVLVASILHRRLCSLSVAHPHASPASHQRAPDISPPC